MPVGSEGPRGPSGARRGLCGVGSRQGHAGTERDAVRSELSVSMGSVRRLLTFVAFIAGFCLVFSWFEWQAREAATRLGLDRPFWYAAAIERLARERIDVFVVGSSRAALAVNETRLSEALAVRAGRPVQVADLGMGYAVWTEHALGVQRLVDAAPDRVRGALLLIEAPSGRTPVGSWGQWYHPFSPGLLNMVLRGDDLPALWRSGEAFDRKMAITLSWLGSRSAFIRHHRAVRDDLFTRLRNRLFGEEEPENLAEALGGTRRQTRALQATKLHTVLQGIGLAETAAPGAPSPVQHLVDVAARAGMIPMLLHVPEYPGRPDTGGYALDPYVAGRTPLGAVPLVRPVAQMTFDDLPDNVHLRPSAANRYTDALAEALTATGHLPTGGSR